MSGGEAGAGFRTGLGTSTEDRITLAGQDLASELMGSVNLGDLAFLVVAKRLPSAEEGRLFNAVLVALCDHGLTPMAISTRLTQLGAPENVQGAIAAGLLGAGSRFLGTVEDAARMLQERISPVVNDAGGPVSDEQLAAMARTVVQDARDRKAFVPGLGHPVHKQGDPRTARLHAIAKEDGLLGPHLRLLGAIGQEAQRSLGKRLPINGAGAGGAALSDLGFHWSIVRGFAVAARAVGLVGHVWEEQQTPMGRGVWEMVERSTTYEDPTDADEAGT